MFNPVKRVGIITGLLRNARLALRLLRDSRVPVITKLLIPGLAIAYVVLPIDLMPDFLPGLGQLDDLALIAVGIKMFVDMCPAWLVQSHREEMEGVSAGAPKNGRKNATVDGDYRMID